MTAADYLPSSDEGGAVPEYHPRDRNIFSNEDVNLLNKSVSSYDYGPAHGSRPGPAERIERLERTILLLAKHVGATGWNKPLQTVLDEIEDDLRKA